MDISECRNLKEFPNVPDSIVELDLSKTGIEEVPPWIENLFRLCKLIMYGCKKLINISPNISKLDNICGIDGDDDDCRGNENDNEDGDGESGEDADDDDGEDENDDDVEDDESLVDTVSDHGDNDDEGRDIEGDVDDDDDDTGFFDAIIE